ncbi:Hypothetical predicted protein, partial [Paramuricea clavata]
MAKPETSEISRAISHLKPPTEFDFDVSNVAHSWKRWREEGREKYETLSFDQEPEKRSFKDIVEAGFSNYCDPKKNETRIVAQLNYQKNEVKRSKTTIEFMLSTLHRAVSKTEAERQTVKKVDTSSDSSDYEEIKMVKVDDKRKPEKSSSTKQFPKRLYASITVGKQPVNFQCDSGATCNVISLSMLERCLGKVQLKGTSRVLKMYNKATVQPVGQCVLQLKNEKTGKSYETEFVVLKQERTPLLGSETIQQMSLITVRYENILLLSVKSSKTALTKDTLMEQYSDVFQGTGKFDEQYHVTIDPDATPVVHPPRP